MAKLEEHSESEKAHRTINNHATDKVSNDQTSDQFVTAVQQQRLYPTLLSAETTPITTSGSSRRKGPVTRRIIATRASTQTPVIQQPEGSAEAPASAVLDAYKQGMQRGLVLGASPQQTSLEETLSKEFALYVTALTQESKTTDPFSGASAPPPVEQASMTKIEREPAIVSQRSQLISNASSTLGKHSAPTSHKAPPSKKGKLSALLQQELSRSSLPSGKHSRSGSLGSVASGLAAMLAEPIQRKKDTNKPTKADQKQKQSWLANLLP